MPPKMNKYAEQRKPGEAAKSIGRLVKMLRGFYPKLFPVAVVCILFSSATSSIPAVFLQKVITDIQTYSDSGDWAAAKAVIYPKVFVLIGLYILSILCMTLWQQLVAIMTHGFLNKMRCAVFDKMQDLPIRYFDTHKHGDIMSHYTNDIDTIRQLLSQALPSLIQAGSVVVFVFAIMIYYSVWLTLVVLLGVAVMLWVSKTIGGGSAKYFIRQQAAVGKTEGFVQEMMNGQKVVQVFNHEQQSQKDFDEINNALFEDMFRAHAFANALVPIIMNIGNVLYVVIATVGGAMVLGNVPNLSVFGLPLGIPIVVPFLNMTKQFTGNLNQVTQQINAIVMAIISWT